MAYANAAGEASVLPWMIDMAMRVIPAGIVSDPLAVGVDMAWLGCSAAGAARGALTGAGPRMGAYPPPTSGLPPLCLSPPVPARTWGEPASSILRSEEHT